MPLDIVVGYAGCAGAVARDHYPVTLQHVNYWGEPTDLAPKIIFRNYTELKAFTDRMDVEHVGPWRLRSES